MKRDIGMPCYELMHVIKDDSGLAFFLNRVIDCLNTVRIISAPRVFEDAKEENQDLINLFYESCLWELWLHNVITRLHEWDDLLNEYFLEYEGKWKFYACSKRIESIKKYGGEDTDYNDDGSIRTLNLTENDLEYYTIISMMNLDCRDIIQDTNHSDLRHMLTCILKKAELSISDIFKEKLGKELTVYTKDENGNIVPMGFSDKVLHKVNEMSKSESICACIYFIQDFIKRILDKINSFDKFTDNNTDLGMVHEDIKNALMFKLSDTYIFKEFQEESDEYISIP